MDPLSAFAMAGTVATFVQMGYRLVVNTYTIYNTASGMAREDEQLGFFIEKLGKLSESMISTTPTLEHSALGLGDAERGMKSVASRCISLSDRLIKILNRSRTKDPRSLRQSAIAAFQGLLNNRKKEELKKELDECQRLFHMELSNTVQILRKVDNVATSSLRIVEGEIAALRQHITELEKGITLTDIGEEAANKIASLVKLSNDSIILIQTKPFLELLSFSKLHQRYEAVGKAHSETFNWIFQDDPNRSPKALQGKLLFTKWLRSGNGIFHIAGKPGSGKSTLMKFIYKHEKTKDLLNCWAAGRRVILGKYFFWRPGEYSSEHSITGLLRTLLYDVLESCPELVPRIFPREWAEMHPTTHPSLSNVYLSYDDIHDAFDRLINGRDVLESRCFFFVIDGLDEFQETRDEGYKDLIRLLSSWTTKAPERIKICVSSREHAVFFDYFSEVQGLRLQDLTSDDIYRFVKEKLESNPNFLEMEKPEDGVNKLVSEVVQKSNGVFLWVALVVKLLDDACDDEDNFQGLERKIDFLPPEVRDLFDELFNSIHESDRDESAQTFTIALKLLKNERGMRLSLLRYSLLDDCNVNPLFASSIDFLDKKFLDWDDEAIGKRLKRARKRLYKRCKGLLEVIEGDDDPLILRPEDGLPGFKDTHLSQRISLIHRSIQEYLEEKQISEERATRTKNFDAVHAICKTYAAELAALKLKKPDCDDRCYYHELLDIINLLSEAGEETARQISIATLQNLDKARPRYLSPIDKNSLNFFAGYPDYIVCIDSMFSVAHTAATYGLDTFFTTWEDPCASTIDQDIRNGSLALVTVWGLTRHATPSNFKRYLSIFRWIFNHGCSPNQAVLDRDGSSPWGALLDAIFIYDSVHQQILSAVEVFLECGANPDFSLVIQEVEDEYNKGTMKEAVKIIPPAAVGTSTLESHALLIHASANKGSQTFKLVSSRDGQATLREFIEDINPPNVETILTLIDRNMNVQRLNNFQAPDQLDKTLPSPQISEPPAYTDVLAEKQVEIEQEASLRSRNDDAGVVIAKRSEARIIILFWQLITAPLATFILGKRGAILRA
ncbi:hypothetical protein F4805DRAFT_456345 [Annulohypoxylon moriforme]|nr:hypothetical protein F4805DRAFT_456345 [Annulohypoxylon moriforme]